MNRILFEKDEIGGDGRAVFGGARAEHVLSVLHGTVGQTLKTGEIDGLAGTSTIEAIEAETLEGPRITVKTNHADASMPPWIDLILAPPRPRVMKRLLPQLAAMGVGRIVLVGAEKVEKAFWGAQLLKSEIYRPLLVDGLMQAGTTAMPEIMTIRSFRRWVSGEDGLEAFFSSQPVRYVAHPYGNGAAPSSQGLAATRPVLAIGPEGGWTEDEVALLEDHGFSRISLGPRILRTDTASIALLARLMP